ncbi:hypothetical protein [Halomonas koreensis]|uniref:Uncharacterized protein n=1 Tax=Halomonas koreensis TaxID=245385 RepID=A0ABU1G576_9GAMM|nr:hypothetical protein [Halomonas koreensis]MDR5868074.1 hypothetical protein [Halomonas koreensis]
MALRTWTPSHHRPWPRLMALLLMMVFACASLSSHATTEACQVDCAHLQGELLETSDSCHAHCAAPVAATPPAVMTPRSPLLTPAIAVSEHVPQPPRRPPRG